MRLLFASIAALVSPCTAAAETLEEALIAAHEVERFHGQARFARLERRVVPPWPRRTELDPFRQQSDFVRLQFGVRRHFQRPIIDRLHQQTFFRIAQNNRRTGVAAFQNIFARIEQQAAFAFFALHAVALVAIIDEDRANFLFEELQLRRLDGGAK